MLALLSCSTDVKVNAPYKEVKVVYCFIDPNLPFQTARISKGFQNEGLSAYEIAKNPDSSQFVSGIIKVDLIEMSNTGIKRILPMKDTLISSKEPGLFYYPGQILYKTANFKVDTGQKYLNIRYKIRITNTRTGAISEAETPIVGRDIDIQRPFADVEGEPYLFTFSNKAPTELRVGRCTNAQIMQAYFFWKVLVTKEGNVTEEEIWRWNSPGDFVFVSDEANSGTATIGPRTFYNFVRSELNRRGNQGVVSRKFLLSELEILSASGDYKKYREAFNNYNSLTQSLPIYTNVSNGLGVMAAINYRRFPIRLSGLSQSYIQDSIPDSKFIP